MKILIVCLGGLFSPHNSFLCFKICIKVGIHMCVYYVIRQAELCICWLMLFPCIPPGCSGKPSLLPAARTLCVPQFAELLI